MHDGWVPFGKLARPHGVRGEIRLIPYNMHDVLPQDVQRLGLADTHTGKILEVSLAGCRRVNQGYLLQFNGVNDRESLASYVGRVAMLHRNDLPALDDSEFFLHDLIGTVAYDEAGLELGTVLGFVNNGEHELLRLRPQPGVAGGERLIPLLDETVVVFDRQQQRLTLRLVPGLLE